MEHLVGGAKAGGGLGNLVDSLLERDRLAEQMAQDGMVDDPGTAGPNAAMAGATMVGEGAAQLGMLAPPVVAPGLDVDDSIRCGAEDDASVQMDAAMTQSQGPSVADFQASQRQADADRPQSSSRAAGGGPRPR